MLLLRSWTGHNTCNKKKQKMLEKHANVALLFKQPVAASPFSYALWVSTHPVTCQLVLVRDQRKYSQRSISTLGTTIMLPGNYTRSHAHFPTFTLTWQMFSLEVHMSNAQCFCFRNWICFLDTLIQEIFFQIMKMNNFLGGQIDILTNKDALAMLQQLWACCCWNVLLFCAEWAAVRMIQKVLWNACSAFRTDNDNWQQQAPSDLSVQEVFSEYYHKT